MKKHKDEKNVEKLTVTYSDGTTKDYATGIIAAIVGDDLYIELTRNVDTDDLKPLRIAVSNGLQIAEEAVRRAK